MLSNPEVTGRLLKWRFELEEHDIHYRPRTLVKGQILVDFVVKRPEDDSPDTPIKDNEELLDLWILFTDGSSCVDGFGADLIIMNPEGIEFTYALRFRFDATNNEAEYEALIAGLWIAEQMGVKNLQANVKNLTSTFKEFSIKQVPRGENKKADTLSNMASTSFAHLSKQVFVKELKEKSIDENEVLAVVEEEGHTCMTPIYEFLTKEILLEEKRKARVIRRKVGRGHEINKGVQKLSGSSPRAKEPTAKLDPHHIPVAICYKWGINIVGPFSEGPGKVKFLIVAIDYFPKWIEAKHVATIMGAQHPQANGLLKRENMSLGEGIKARFDERSKNWLEEISHILWAHRTMIKSSNGETSFSLMYGTKAVIPVEIGMTALRNAEVDMIKKR
nr:reverse transcriptase domain-containing protein [Tanacetum cinerariifolium]